MREVFALLEDNHPHEEHEYLFCPRTPLRGGVALLTGATGGLGPAMATTLAEAGMHVALTARSAPELHRLAAHIESLGVRAAALPADLRDAQAVATLVRCTEEQLGPLDVVVHSIEVCATREGAQATRRSTSAEIVHAAPAASRARADRIIPILPTPGRRPS